LFDFLRGAAVVTCSSTTVVWLLRRCENVVHRRNLYAWVDIRQLYRNNPDRSNSSCSEQV